MALSHFRDVHLTSTGCDVTEVPEPANGANRKDLRSKTDVNFGLYATGNRPLVDAEWVFFTYLFAFSWSTGP